MANRRAIVKRRKAVRNIKKITRTMQLIATARFQAALNRAVATRPYTDKLAELVADLSGVAEDFAHPLLESRETVKRSSLIILTSNRGLCGGYNANVLRTAVKHLREQKAAGIETDVHMVGKKGVSAFRFQQRPTVESITDIEDKPRFQQVEPIGQNLIERFLSGEVDAVHVAYMRFFSAGRQIPEVFQLLPLTQPATEGSGSTSYEIKPSAEKLLNEILPATVRMRLFQSFNDAAVSEQIARMAAMKAATEAAQDMIGNLTREYNRARQTQITLELLDIVGGANALN
ncbi:MAG: ATP synthase F1 subunit gamma [Deltaproteobacteria bacterium]|nr:ATP synthase F1 subunit gamma [Deltaproteobacteria bacterium]